MRKKTLREKQAGIWTVYNAPADDRKLPPMTEAELAFCSPNWSASLKPILKKKIK
jgi:hypothetical protein